MTPETCSHGKQWAEPCIVCDIAWAQARLREARSHGYYWEEELKTLVAQASATSASSPSSKPALSGRRSNGSAPARASAHGNLRPIPAQAPCRFHQAAHTAAYRCFAGVDWACRACHIAESTHRWPFYTRESKSPFSYLSGPSHSDNDCSQTTTLAPPDLDTCSIPQARYPLRHISQSTAELSSRLAEANLPAIDY